MTAQAATVSDSQPAVFECGDLELQSGQVLPDARLVYRTYGELSPARDNVVVIPTYYTGTHESNEGFFGPGRAIDPDRHFIVCPNMFGNGLSTSPSNAAPAVRGPRFPQASLYDNVMAQRRLLEEGLGIERVALVVGWSMGGCQAYHWGALHADMVERILPFCASARTSPHNLVFLEGVKAALEADSAFRNGAYEEPPIKGLKAFARVYAGWAYSQTFYREGLYRQLGYSTVDDLLAGWEQDHLCWDANNLLAMLSTWQRADISANERFGGDLAAALGEIRARAIVMPCTTDLYFPPEDNAIEVERMPNAELRPIRSDWGHCVASRGGTADFARILDAAISDLLDGSGG